MDNILRTPAYVIALLSIAACSVATPQPPPPSRASPLATVLIPTTSPTPTPSPDCPGNTPSDPPWVCVRGPAPTPGPSPTLTPSQTYDFGQLFTRTPPPTWPPKSVLPLYSPDGKYVAVLYENWHVMNGSNTLEVYDSAGNSVWRTDFQLAQEDPSPYMCTLGWSEDSSSLYYLYYWSPDGGDYAFWWDGYDLMRVQIPSGRVQHLIPGSGLFRFSSFAISPGDKYLAYVRELDNSSILYIRDLSSNTIRRALIIGQSDRFVRAGDIHWSPSGRSLAFQVELEDYSVLAIYLDTNTMQQKIVMQYQMGNVEFEGWLDDGTLQFFKWPENLVSLVDAASGEITVLATPTPIP